MKILVLIFALMLGACATAPGESSTEQGLCTVEVCDEYGCYHQIVGCQGNGGATGLPPTTPTGPTSGPVSCVPYNCDGDGHNCTFPAGTCGSSNGLVVTRVYTPYVPSPYANRVCVATFLNSVTTACTLNTETGNSHWETTRTDWWMCSYFGTDPQPGLWNVPITRWIVDGPSCTGGSPPANISPLPTWWNTTKTTGGGGGGSTEPPCHGSGCTVEQSNPTQQQ